MSPNDNDFEKSNTAINIVCESNASYNTVFLSNEHEFLSQNINKSKLHKAVCTESNKHTINGMYKDTDNICQDDKSSITTVSMSLNPFESGVAKTASQELSKEKTQKRKEGMQTSGRLEPQAKNNSKSEAMTKKLRQKWKTV